MIKNINLLETKMSEKFPLLADQLKGDIKYEIIIKNILCSWLYIYFDSLTSKYLLRVRSEGRSNTLVACSTLQEARKNFFVYYLNINSTKNKHWHKWEN